MKQALSWVSVRPERHQMEIMSINSLNASAVGSRVADAQDAHGEFGRARRPAALFALAAKGCVCVCVRRLKKETHVVTVGFCFFLS